MKSLAETDKVRRICKDFYPNCTFCSCFRICFPQNESEDLMSQTIIKQEKENLKKMNSPSRSILVQEDS